MNELFTRRIETTEECERWIRDLVKADLDFHFDDDPTEIGSTPNGIWERTFTNEEAIAVRERVNILFDQLTDPFEILIDALQHSAGAAYLEVIEKI